MEAHSKHGWAHMTKPRISARVFHSHRFLLDCYARVYGEASSNHLYLSPRGNRAQGCLAHLGGEHRAEMMGTGAPLLPLLPRAVPTPGRLGSPQDSS